MKIGYSLQTTVIFCVLALLFINFCEARRAIVDQNGTFSGIQNSYVKANEPEKSEFDSFLKRDLSKYFKGIVKTELLRRGATQSGVAYPKYYVWLKIYKGHKLVNEGAVRVESVERKRFEITDFVSIGEMKNNSKDIYAIFPALVCEKIKSHF